MKRVIDIYKGFCDYITSDIKAYDVGTGYLAFQVNEENTFLLCRVCESNEFESKTFIQEINNSRQTDTRIVILQRGLSSINECDLIVKQYKEVYESLINKLSS